ncbi:hypothetical protein [Marivivens marinus]
MRGDWGESAIRLTCRFIRVSARFYAVGVVVPGLAAPLAGLLS